MLYPLLFFSITFSFLLYIFLIIKYQNIYFFIWVNILRIHFSHYFLYFLYFFLIFGLILFLFMIILFQIVFLSLCILVRLLIFKHFIRIFTEILFETLFIIIKIICDAKLLFEWNSLLSYYFRKRMLQLIFIILNMKFWYQLYRIRHTIKIIHDIDRLIMLKN